ncbi:hypothetical protein CIL05_13765 [Virgibacillus profundi]|uniref:Uncharacterized protein n=1 Tax=Virgibacillus profundi TaxID=2024555 RepID=A0A2A2IBU9_9BACI|nr:hypothetical protein [Virgibacillus profundi]PAV29042.1 hypothetical protein CIL05_13765 [Virgibacillus profundi]PXY53211.1 hypothetical protein CIT14_13890 [Virgibacillus profundi]
MSDNRITTIVKEINYWKQHNLLPEVYCDFLLALYTKGENEEVPEPSYTKAGKIMLIIQLILLLLLLPFSFLVLYFTQFHLILQISILFLFLCYSFWIYVYFKKSENGFYHIALITNLIIILMATVYLCKLYFDLINLLYIVIMLNFIFWLLVSYKNKIKYLMVCSVLGILFTVSYIVL